jgi:hypothetical protein
MVGDVNGVGSGGWDDGEGDGRRGAISMVGSKGGLGWDGNESSGVVILSVCFVDGDGRGYFEVVVVYRK